MISAESCVQAFAPFFHLAALYQGLNCLLSSWMICSGVDWTVPELAPRPGLCCVRLMLPGR